MILVLFGANVAESRHIIGGEMSYDCLGNDRYRITMVLYRDCQSANGAEFDSYPGSTTTGTASVYHGDSNIPFIHTIILSRPEVSELDPNLSNPCLIVPPVVCVEKGVYEFEVELPNSDEPYHIAYQRCCRNPTIQNIYDPDEYGATFTIEISPRAQDLCFDSPESLEYPPIAICLGETLEHSLDISDGRDDTQITYDFCHPLHGGSRFRAAPNPDTPPPYERVRFRDPVYEVDKPITGMPGLTLDGQNGIISGRPNRLGQYVVGICATQWHEGEILTVLQTEFQFNVTECQKTVNLKLDGAIEEEGDTLKFKECVENLTYRFQNLSTDEDFIESYDWEISSKAADTLFSTERNASFTFPDTGFYYGKMILNKHLDGCNDSAYFSIEVRNSIDAGMNIETEECYPTSVIYTNSSQSGNGDITSTKWIFEDTIVNRLEPNRNTLLDTGANKVFLEVEDAFQCSARDTITIDYAPIEYVPDVDVSSSQLCVSYPIIFANNSLNVTEEFKYLWDFGNGDTATTKHGKATYDHVGTYDVSLRLIAPDGCEYDTTFVQLLHIDEVPKALYENFPDEITSFDPEVSFNNLSEASNSYTWLVDGMLEGDLETEGYHFRDTGIHRVTLIAENSKSCLDSFALDLDVIPVSTFYLPNAFSPNNDGKNDEYKGKGVFKFIQSFTLKIYDRWGRIQFATNDPKAGWNGRNMNDGKLCTDDIYYCTVKYVDYRGEKYETESRVQVLR